MFVRILVDMYLCVYVFERFTPAFMMSPSFSHSLGSAATEALANLSTTPEGTQLISGTAPLITIVSTVMQPLSSSIHIPVSAHTEKLSFWPVFAGLRAVSEKRTPLWLALSRNWDEETEGLATASAACGAVAMVCEEPGPAAKIAAANGVPAMAEALMSGQLGLQHR